MAELNFNAAQYEPSTGAMDPIPAGWYNAAVDESELKPTKTPGGAYLQLRFTVLDGKHANRKLYVRLNIRNANPVAQEIAYKDLSAICHAVGIMNLGASEQLHNIPMKVRVKVRPATGDYEASNEITTFKNINEQVEMADASTPATATPMQMPPAQQAAQPAQQPFGQQPAQMPQQQPWQAPAAAQPAAAPQQQAPVQQQPAQQGGWQAPAQAQQPWGQPAEAQQQAPAQPQQQAFPQQSAEAAPPFAQQPAQQQPAQEQQPQQAAAPQGMPQQGAMPPWAQGQ